HTDPFRFSKDNERKKSMKEKESTPVLCESPKGVGIVIPLVTSWPDSVVVMDVTHDDWKIKEEANEKA
ncbi:type IV secretory system conjugative DNA transfer family protein, partial [Escherichia coli]|nr:type IV secretory system conjugative DNA transfer family protein [Escherichia coli]